MGTLRPLILHVGMPKTGTSSLQESLFRCLSDRRFRYVGLGMVNASRAIQCLVGDEPVVRHAHPSQGIDPEAIRQLAPHFRGCWERQMKRAIAADATPIVSAEDCWFMARKELERLRELIEAASHRAKVIVYLRPPLAWLASMFQELLKSGHHRFVDELLIDPSVTRSPGWDHLERLETFAEVFGRDRLCVRLFRREALAEGCVVADFCREVGIDMRPRRVRRVNESLSLEATRFLYAFNRHVRATDRRAFREVLLLLRRLQECPGQPPTLHPDLLAPVQSRIAASAAAIGTDFGIELREEFDAHGVEVLRSEEDLLRYSSESLEWLDAALGGRSAGVDPPAVAADVARLRPRFRHRLEDVVRGRLQQVRMQWANR